ncbi:MAG: universal stress protein [Gemmatimonadaceae bacterium]|nr:universal stress protein [Gemmatimonadaceae bacterium]
MTETVQSSSGAFVKYGATALPTGPILIATDTSPDSDAAFPLAQVVAAQTHADVHIISVLGPFATSMYAFDGMPMPSEPDDGPRLDREVAVRAQLDRLVSSNAGWPVIVRGGESTREIVDYGATVDARVVLAGRGHHGAIGRLLGGETILRMLQLGDRPILAVEPGLTWLPRRVVIATDLSEYSVYAARVAVSLIAPDATVHLVNVGPEFEKTDPILRERAVAFREQARHRFVEIRELLDGRELQFEEALLTGNAADELLRYAESVRADLIVSATHGYGFVRRLLLGSVASVLVRGAPCSVLCVPGSARTTSASNARALDPGHTRIFATGARDAELSAFSDRHRGHPCTVSIHQPELGAQVLGHALTFVGATYDPHARVASLMFGASQLAGAHLTHSVTGVSEIDLSIDGAGHDRVLRLVHGTGYTLVALE